MPKITVNLKASLGWMTHTDNCPGSSTQLLGYNILCNRGPARSERPSCTKAPDTDFLAGLAQANHAHYVTITYGIVEGW